VGRARQRLDVDLVALTGDYVDERHQVHHDIAEALTWLRRDGVVAGDGKS
jgi:predicted MPP superfamily phosphohydrolase